jgi:hypothetical protein
VMEQYNYLYTGFVVKSKMYRYSEHVLEVSWLHH